MKYSLNTMLEILKSNEQDTLNLGDSMVFKLSSGEEVTAEIIGFNHDKVVGRKRSAKATFRFTIDGEFNMNDEWTNAGGWGRSKMRESYCRRLFKLLPQELQKNIKEVEKYTVKGNGSSELVTTKDKIFLLSVTEVKGDEYSPLYRGEGKQYELFKKKGYKFSKWSWLRSPGVGGSTAFYFVSTDGMAGRGGANGYFGVCFAFAI